MSDLLRQNALIDAQQLAESLDREFIDGDVVQYREHGINLDLAAEVFVSTYQGDNRFVKTVLKPKMERGKLTAGMVRAAMNILRQELLGIDFKSKTKPPTTHRCFVCEEEFPTWDALMAHKSQQHSSKPAPVPFTEDNTEPEAVIANTVATKGLDLSNLPDGRYAAPNPTGQGQPYIYFLIKRVRHTHKRDRRYVYGKVVTGNEVVVAGTIEVKTWTSDAKELIGEQKPGDVYRGDHEDLLELILMMPEPWAILFGKLTKHCCRCGKTLTDEISQSIGLGLECEKALNEAYFKKPPKFTFVGTDRPDAEKADPNDEKYLTGQWTRYQEPPKVAAS